MNEFTEINNELVLDHIHKFEYPECQLPYGPIDMINACVCGAFERLKGFYDGRSFNEELREVIDRSDL